MIHTHSVHVISQLIGMQFTLTLTESVVIYVRTRTVVHLPVIINIIPMDTNIVHISSEPSQLDITHLSVVNVVLVFNASAIARPPSAPSSFLYKLQLHRWYIILLYMMAWYVTHSVHVISQPSVTVHSHRHSRYIYRYIRTSHHYHR